MLQSHRRRPKPEAAMLRPNHQQENSINVCSSSFLGHSSTSITQDIYQHTSYEDFKEDVFDMFATPVPSREVPAITLN